jgi:hypothetical protein
MDTDNVIPETEMARRRRVFQLVDDLGELCRIASDRITELDDLEVPGRDWVAMVVERSDNEIAKQMLGNGLLQLGLGGFAEVMVAHRRDGKDKALAKLVSLTKTLGLPDDLVQKIFSGDASDEELLEGGVKHSMSQRPRDIVTIPGGIDCDSTPYMVANMVDTFAAARMKLVIDRLLAEAPKLETPGKGPDADQVPAVQAHVVTRAGAAMFGALSKTPEGGLRLMAPNKANGKDVLVEHFFDYGDVVEVAIMREMTASSHIVSS